MYTCSFIIVFFLYRGEKIHRVPLLVYKALGNMYLLFFNDFKLAGICFVFSLEHNTAASIPDGKVLLLKIRLFIDPLLFMFYCHAKRKRK